MSYVGHQSAGVKKGRDEKGCGRRLDDNVTMTRVVYCISIEDAMAQDGGVEDVLDKE